MAGAAPKPRFLQLRRSGRERGEADPHVANLRDSRWFHDRIGDEERGEHSVPEHGGVLDDLDHALNRAPMTSWSCAVSTYCWNFASLPCRTVHRWHTCGFIVFPVALCVPL